MNKDDKIVSLYNYGNAANDFPSVNECKLRTNFDRAYEIVARLRLLTAMLGCSYIAQPCLPLLELDIDGKVDDFSVERYLRFFLYVRFRQVHYYGFNDQSDKFAIGSLRVLFDLLSEHIGRHIILENVDFSLDLSRDTPREFNEINDVIRDALDEAESTFYEKMLDRVYQDMFKDMTPQFSLSNLGDLIFAYSRIELNMHRDSTAYSVCEILQKAIILGLIRTSVRHRV